MLLRRTQTSWCSEKFAEIEAIHNATLGKEEKNLDVKQMKFAVQKDMDDIKFLL